jgi:sensor histidine kinase YesM
MKISQNKKEFLLVVVLATLMSVLMCPSCMLNFAYAWKMEVIMLSIWLVMWYGNGYVSHYIDRHVSWLDNPAKRFGLGVLATVVYSTLAILLLAVLFNSIFEINIGNKWQLVWLSIGISVVILLFMLSKEFLYSWRDLALREEKMRNEVLVSRYEVLKNQINPHFMFNSLNALSTLVYEDQDLAVKYISQLSKVFRYVLQAGKQEMVTLMEEIEVLESYIFLQKIRYNDNLIIEMDLASHTDRYYIAPLVLQMLIENAIKHNEITADNPLKIELHIKDEYLVVRNNLQPKDTALQESTGMGLANIKERYKSLIKREIIIEESATEFSVSIPLIKEGL